MILPYFTHYYYYILQRGAGGEQAQIQEREEERMRQQELLDMEREAMLVSPERVVMRAACIRKKDCRNVATTVL